MTLCLCPLLNCADDFKHTNVPACALTSKVSPMIMGLKINHSSYTIMVFLFFFHTPQKKKLKKKKQVHALNLYICAKFLELKKKKAK